MSARPRQQPNPPPDSTAEFERALQAGDRNAHYVLRLYVAGSTARSAQAVATIRSLCEEHLAGRYDLEVVDLYQQPQAAVGEQIVAAPTLVKKLPAPVRRMVGNLSDRDRVLVGLDLRGTGSSAGPVGEMHWVKV